MIFALKILLNRNHNNRGLATLLRFFRKTDSHNHGQKGLRIFYSDEQIRTTTTFAHQTQPHPLPPESMLVNAHTTMIWCSNNNGLGGEGGLKWKLSTYFDTGCYKV